jgi:hypothetical protein
MEFFLFGGVPETPEPVFERDVQGHSELRRSRGAPTGRRFAAASHEREVLESYEFSLGEEVVSSEEEEPATK